jgi:hypothetical protein
LARIESTQRDAPQRETALLQIIGWGWDQPGRIRVLDRGPGSIHHCRPYGSASIASRVGGNRTAIDPALKIRRSSQSQTMDLSIGSSPWEQIGGQSRPPLHENPHWILALKSPPNLGIEISSESWQANFFCTDLSQPAHRRLDQGAIGSFDRAL